MLLTRASQGDQTSQAQTSNSNDPTQILLGLLQKPFDKQARLDKLYI